MEAPEVSHIDYTLAKKMHKPLSKISLHFSPRTWASLTPRLTNPHNQESGDHGHSTESHEARYLPGTLLHSVFGGRGRFLPLKKSHCGGRHLQRNQHYNQSDKRCHSSGTFGSTSPQTRQDTPSWSWFPTFYMATAWSDPSKDSRQEPGLVILTTEGDRNKI